jgi:hypothetical protein
MDIGQLIIEAPDMGKMTVAEVLKYFRYVQERCRLGKTTVIMNHSRYVALMGPFVDIN